MYCSSISKAISPCIYHVSLTSFSTIVGCVTSTRHQHNTQNLYRKHIFSKEHLCLNVPLIHPCQAQISFQNINTSVIIRYHQSPVCSFTIRHSSNSHGEYMYNNCEQSFDNRSTTFLQSLNVRYHKHEINHLSTIYQPHLSTIYQPFINHLSIIYQPFINHLSTIYQPFIK